MNIIGAVAVIFLVATVLGLASTVAILRIRRPITVALEDQLSVLMSDIENGYGARVKSVLYRGHIDWIGLPFGVVIYDIYNPPWRNLHEIPESVYYWKTPTEEVLTVPAQYEIAFVGGKDEEEFPNMS